MKFDVFFSICQTEVDGYLPSEEVMWKNFFEQIRLADDLGYETAWIAETHLSSEIQKQNPNPVIPSFRGEIGLNTDIFQISHVIFSKTKRIHTGSAIRNILCNGGPIAHAECARTFSALQHHFSRCERKLHLGFAAGRFEFSNRPYGIFPRDEVERAAWPVVKGKIFHEAVEIFLKLLRGDALEARSISERTLARSDFRSDDDWNRVLKAYGDPQATAIPLNRRWSFERLQIIPKEDSIENIRLFIGSHDPKTQEFANEILPCGVFNLSITPDSKIEETHERMKKKFHPDGGKWTRGHMPRTALVFINAQKGLSAEAQDAEARKEALSAMENYWKAVEGTLDAEKIKNAVDNAIVGSPQTVLKQLKQRFHSDDRLMLWFDFNDHNNERVMRKMKWFWEEVVPHA